MRFEIGREYRRQDLHARYGGQEQQGIVTPANTSIIWLITGRSGATYGYTDGWEPEGVYRYFGEGQTGHMTFDRATNRRVRDHAENGDELHLFEDLKEGMLRYLGEMSLAGWKHEENVPDGDKNLRTAIVFYLAPLAGTAAPPVELPGHDTAVPDTNSSEWSRTLDDLRDRAEPGQFKVPDPKVAMQKVRARSRALRVYVLRRANGICEGCEGAAPFNTPNGQAFLEAHHTRRLSDGGVDDPGWVIAVCPNCHRRAHYAQDAEAFNEDLKARVQSAERNALAG